MNRNLVISILPWYLKSLYLSLAVQTKCFYDVNLCLSTNDCGFLASFWKQHTFCLIQMIHFYFRRGRKRKLKEDFGDFIGFGIKRRASLNQTGTTNSSLNLSATTVSSLDQSVSDTTHNQSHTGTVKRRASLNQTGTTNSSLNQSASTVSSLDQSVNDTTHNQSHTGTVNISRVMLHVCLVSKYCLV